MDKLNEYRKIVCDFLNVLAVELGCLRYYLVNAP